MGKNWVGRGEKGRTRERAESRERQCKISYKILEYLEVRIF